MAGQGKTTRLYASALREEGWEVIYTCIPNSPHVKVVPIPTSHGVSKQRYPDILAIKKNRILLVEVEMMLTNSVAQDISLRFYEMQKSLKNTDIYRGWSRAVEISSNVTMPITPDVEMRLKLVNGLNVESSPFLENLSRQNITIVLD
ncbi:PDDEXK family nuclease [Pectobacterium aroidearum]|uniref:hypothetical protein n=1 Tax=Pectobacterium aroidearum TaxID=1201031 RepID=UPI001CD5B400|nr:hypothetical protein [Pectobacterium aroidearum]